MRNTRYKLALTIAVTAVLSGAASAGAAEIPVLGKDGRMTERFDPGVAKRDRTVATRGTHREHRATTARLATHARRPTPLGVMKGYSAAGDLDRATYLADRAAYTKARTLGKKLPGRRGLEMRGVVGIVDGMAARGTLTLSRLPVLTLTLQRNAQWWGGDGSLLNSGVRVSFEGSELVWQSVPGQGIQFHPLANFGKLNQLYKEKLSGNRMEQLMDELLPLQAQRAGGTAWEYYYAFDGGVPPWTSSLSQGTGLQAVARAATRSGRAAEVFPGLKSGLAIFRTAPPQGVMTSADGGKHYAQYTFWPKLRILNGFIQSLVGLYDYSTLTQDPVGLQLFTEGEVAARKEVPTYDTGAWSLYSRGSITRESDMNYHQVLIDFLTNLCDRTDEATYCNAVTSFTNEKTTPPVVSLVTQQLRAGARGQVKVRLSKISRVTLQLRRGGKLVYSSSTILGYGTRSWSVTPPKATRSYDVSVTATDLAGNRAEPLEGTIRVLKPRKRT